MDFDISQVVPTPRRDCYFWRFTDWRWVRSKIHDTGLTYHLLRIDVPKTNRRRVSPPLWIAGSTTTPLLSITFRAFRISCNKTKSTVGLNRVREYPRLCLGNAPQGILPILPIRKRGDVPSLHIMRRNSISFRVKV